MGSRVAIDAFCTATKHKGFWFEKLPSQQRIGFANSSQDTCSKKLRVWFPTEPPTSTCFEILDKGDIPLLMSLGQMMNLKFNLACSPEGINLTSPFIHGGRPVALHFSTSRHVVIDLADVAFYLGTKSAGPPPGLVAPAARVLRSDRSDQSDLSDRSDRPDRSDRSEQSDRSDRADRLARDRCTTAPAGQSLQCRQK